MQTFKKICLFINTIKYLKFRQIWWQIIKRFNLRKKTKHIATCKQAIAPKWNKDLKIEIPELDEDHDYLQRFDLDLLLKNQIKLLHEVHKFDPNNWHVEGASHLWNFNLHYLEYLIPLAVAYRETSNPLYYDKWKEVLGSWIKNSSNDSFEPYTISMRIPNILISIDIIGEIQDDVFAKKIYDSIYAQYCFLARNTEKHLLANHYFENLKTLVICSLLFNETERFDRFFRSFLAELDEQILDDGIHYERSVMYHKIILEDLLRVAVVLNSVGQDEHYLSLMVYVKKMGSALASIEDGINRTPLFNDAGDNVAKSKDQLVKAMRTMFNIELNNSITEFPAAGYYKLQSGLVTVLFDCGETGPRYMGGHAHNDALSFELFLNGEPLFVNAGTYQYQDRLRPFFRSNKAHNTLSVDDGEFSELWGEHRSARRMRQIYAERTQGVVKGTLTSFNGVEYRRKLCLEYNGENTTLSIEDEVLTFGVEHTLDTYFRVAPGYTIHVDDVVTIVDISGYQVAVIHYPPEVSVMVHTAGDISSYASEFGRLEKTEVVAFTTKFTKSTTLDYMISIFERGD